MEFEHLKIVGFKTFADPVDVPISAGLTGIIGPNGCGKSNLVEALRWCMGESSSKAMRAGEMDDVIFAGSSARPSRNFAEVTLVLNNENRTAPAIFNAEAMIQVRRKLMREAGSHYKVNLKDARARDVQLLFADAATGARSPSMVRQGQISELIMAKPTARRRILEDAAGISGLAARRHEAELRLNAATQNLEKLANTLVELESQQQKLQKQAREAIKFRKIEAEILVLEYKICHAKYENANSNLVNITNALAEAKLHYTQANMRILDIETAAVKDAQNYESAKEKLELLSKELQEKTAAQKLLHIEIARFLERKSGISQQLHTLTGDLERAHNLNIEATGQVENLQTEHAKLKSLLPSDAARVQEALLHSTQAEELRIKADSHRTQIAQEYANAKAHAQMACNMVREAQDSLQVLITKLDAVKSTIQALPQTTDLQAYIAELKAQKQESIDKIQSITNDIADQEISIESCTANVQTLQAQYNSIFSQFEAAQLEIKTLTNIIKASITHNHPKLSDTIIIQKGYEAAVAAALKHELMMSVNSEDATHIVPVTTQKIDAQLPKAAVPLQQFVSGIHVLSRALNMIGLVDTLEDYSPQDLAAGQALVTKSGEILRWDGVRLSRNLALSETHILVQKNRLIALNAQAPQQQADLQSAREQLSIARDEQQSAIAALKMRKELYAQMQIMLSQCDKTLSQSLANLNIIEINNSSTLAHYKSLEQQVQDARTIVTQKQALIDSAPAQNIDENALEMAQTALQTAHAHSIQARVHYEELVRETDKRSGRIHHVEKDIAAWQRRRDEADWTVNRLKARLEELRKDAKQFELTSVDGMERRDSELIREIAATQNAMIAQKQAVEVLECTLKDSAAQQKHATEAMQTMRDAVTRLEVQTNSAQEVFQAAALDLEQLTPPGTQTDLLEQPTQISQDITQFDIQLERLKRMKNSIGEVNLIAEAELNEIVERYNALVQDQNDVTLAVVQFRESIAKLNFEGRVRLQKAFDAIHVHFTQLFQTLFEGGEAELIRTGGEDPLEWGLDIIANPPGKKPQNLSLLSGGEQALTAMALIFAVFLSNPSPICVLDEVDAPLDDANVERFCKLLDEMKRQTSTRFLIITHNPITMSHMDQLYGVTMPERGVSQIVSVQLREAIELVEAA